MEFVIGILIAKVKRHFFFLISSEISCAFPATQISGNILSASGYTSSFLEITRK